MADGISELQLSLIVIGLLAVAAVWGYNLWQERRYRQHGDKTFRGGQDQPDVLMQGGQPGQMDAEEVADITSVTDGADVGGVPPVVQAATAATASHHTAAAPTWRERIEPGGGLGTATVVTALTDVAEASEMAETGATNKRADLSEPAAASLSASASPASTPFDAPEASEFVDSSDPADFAGAMDAPAPAESVPMDEENEPGEPPENLADPLIDCVVHLEATELISAPLFWAAQRQILSRLVNRVVWSGFDENSGSWQRLQAKDANSYRRLVAALQLVDRNGSVAADDLALFCDGVRQLAAHYQAQARVPVVADVLARARSLDEFCASVDWRLSFNLVHAAGQGLSVMAIRQLADIAGLRPCDKTQKMDGLLHGLDSRGMTAFTLARLDGQAFDAEGASMDGEANGDVLTPGLKLSIDVPRASDGVVAFERMMQVAELIGTRLNAVIVDDQRRELPAETLTLIREKVTEFQKKMQVQQIPAGSPRALRLYA